MESVYFAYGSNMSPSRLRARLPRITPLGRACLLDWRLAFDKPSRDGSAKANIQRQPDQIVWGVMWQIEAEDWITLDRFEPGYERLGCAVAPGPSLPARSAFTYVYPGPACRQAPFDWYLDYLIDGASAHDLPETWRTELNSVRARCVTSAEVQSVGQPPKPDPAAKP
ncbi:MAG: gamma-glutamylcyclotransferase [Myxococcota bacterium]|nr:gamma-glutamylcyclotransferase [Myxococcota bacterium]